MGSKDTRLTHAQKRLITRVVLRNGIPYTELGAHDVRHTVSALVRRHLVEIRSAAGGEAVVPTDRATDLVFNFERKTAPEGNEGDDGHG